MVPLIVQILAVLGGAALVRVLLARLGVELGVALSAAVAVLVFLFASSTINMREQWKRLDAQRDEYRYLQNEPNARAACQAVGIDTGFMSFLGSRIPVRERFYLESEPLKGTGEYCVRFLLLPRRQVRDPKDAKYLVFWDPPSRATLERVRREGASIARWDDGHLIAVRP